MAEVDTFREQTRATKYQQKFTLPPNFADVLKDFTREVLRQQPLDVYEWSATYFKEKALQEDGVEMTVADSEDKLPEEFVETSAQLNAAFAAYDEGQTGTLFPHLLKRVLTESAGLTPTQTMLVLSNPDFQLLTDGTVQYSRLVGSAAVLQQISYLQSTGHDFPHPAPDTTVHGMAKEELHAELGAVFKSIDADAMGSLTISDYCKALKSCPMQLTARDINLLILEAPVNGDGNVVWEKLLEDSFPLLCLAHSFTAFDQSQ